MASASDDKSIQLMTMVGWSMSPVLKAGDVVVVQQGICEKEIKMGDIVCFENKELEKQIVHRIIEFKSNVQEPIPYVVKGDRLKECDSFTRGWKVNGVVLGRFRNGVYKNITNKLFFKFLSKRGLFPGQKLPLFLGASWWKQKQNV